MLAVNYDTLRAQIYEIKIKSSGFLGPAPLTQHVMQAAGYEQLVATSRPAMAVESFVVAVSAVTGEYRIHPLDRGAHASEILARLEERQWNTAPGDEMPDPSIPDEAYVERGRKSNKKLVNLLCERYCGFRQCEFNHVGEEEALADE